MLLIASPTLCLIVTLVFNVARLETVKTHHFVGDIASAISHWFWEKFRNVLTNFVIWYTRYYIPA
jgi:hypothetical protein